MLKIVALKLAEVYNFFLITKIKFPFLREEDRTVVSGKRRGSPVNQEAGYGLYIC